MPHARQQIREAVASALTGLATTGARVHQSRMRPADAAGLPCLLITTDGEQIDTDLQTHQTRLLTITVRGLAKAASNVDDTLDAIASEVEAALNSAGTLGNKVPGGVVLKEIDVDFDDALDKPAGVVVMQYQAGYYTLAGSPGTIV